MRSVIAPTLLTLFAAGHVEAGNTERLPASFNYDIEVVSTTLELALGRSRISISIANALELPEYEPPGGVGLNEAILLTEEFPGFDVDTGEERMFSLTLSFDW
ncbi:MAG: hypothetical protein QNJ07_05030 [Woeseiaceae bacterium]|nr:hypothetical protein [Woeseiaceae bacterium]